MEADIVKFSGGLKAELKQNEVVKRIELKINNIANVRAKKMDIEILLHICNMVEQYIDNKKKKYDKEKIVLMAYDVIFGALNDAEKLTIKKNIAYLLESKSIKKVHWIYVWGHYAWNFFFKKV